MSSADILRALYQENAAVFLAACATQHMGPNENKREGSASTSTINNTSSSILFDPLAVANALRIRSIYEVDVTAPRIDSKCIISNTKTEKTEELNLIRSGGDEVLVPAEVGDTQAAKAMLIFRTQKRLVEKQKAGGMSLAAATIQLAESINDYMVTHATSNQKILRHDFHCKGCGNALLPTPFSVHGYGIPSSQIRLKTLKRGNTRRRRASRHTAKNHTYDTNILQKHRGGGRSFGQGKTTNHGNAVASVMSTQEALKKNNAARRKRDGISKHCISYQCYCGTDQCIRGMKRQRGYNQDVASMIQSNRSPTISIGNEKSNKSKHETKNALPDSGDFLRLENLASTGAPLPSVERKLKLLEQPQSRRRKPKGKTPIKKKSGLQNFLSSLND
jgi:hypothetical protein